MALREGSTLVIGPGPVMIGEGSYRQYAAARACRFLRQAGERVVVLENDPATLMDLGGGPEGLYMEPPDSHVLKRIKEEEAVDTIWYGLGGHRGALLALELEVDGWHGRFPLETPDLRLSLLGGDRSTLHASLEGRGLCGERRAAASPREGQDIAQELGFPLLVRPDFSRAGWGAGLAYNLEEYPVLLSDALRESATGRVLIERPRLEGRKYITTILRDAQGRFACPGIVEQIEPLPRHEGDSILVCPAITPSAEQAEALRDMARSLADKLEVLGLCEFKLCLDAERDEIKFLDLNCGPGRQTAILEILSGRDLIQAHIDLILGKPMPPDVDKNMAEAFTLVVPKLPDIADADESYSSLACNAISINTFRGRDIREAAAMALNRQGEACSLEQRGLLAAIGEAGRSKRGIERIAQPSLREDASPICLSSEKVNDDNALAIVGPANEDPGSYELEAACSRALHAVGGNNQKIFLYTANVDFALFAADEADAVFLGPLESKAIDEWAEGCGVNGIIYHFSGSEGIVALVETKPSRVPVLGWSGSGPIGDEEIYARLKGSGIPVLEAFESDNAEGDAADLEKASYPILAVIRNDRRKERVLLYSQDDALRLVEGLADGDKMSWRELPEEVQEIQLEAVAGVKPGDTMLFWEQLDEAAISNCDGLGVYPPFYLTSEQQDRAACLARRAIEQLSFKGNLSMRILMRNGDSWVEEINPGASPNLAFLERASGLPLSAMGMNVLLDLPIPQSGVINSCSVVRMPVIPYSAIADSDILPSPRRRSTGSILGVASSPAAALAKALWGEGIRPRAGRIAFLSVANREKRRAILLARELRAAGYSLMATRGTAHALTLAGIEVETVNKLKEGRPNILDHIRNGEVGLIINIPRGKFPHGDGFYIRASSARHGIPCITNIEFALALTRGLRHSEPQAWEILPLARYAGARQKILEG